MHISHVKHVNGYCNLDVSHMTYSNKFKMCFSDHYLKLYFSGFILSKVQKNAIP